MTGDHLKMPTFPSLRAVQKQEGGSGGQKWPLVCGLLKADFGLGPENDAGF